MQERAVPGTWLGIYGKTGQSYVAISPSKVVRVRTIQRRPEAERWSPHIIMTLQATPQKPDASGEVHPEGNAVDADELDTGEPFEPEDPSMPGSSKGAPRRPRLTAAQRIELGLTPGCKACERLITGQSGIPHTQECWERVTSILETTEEGRQALLRAQTRMELYSRAVSESVTPETAAQPPPSPPPVWPENAEVPSDEVSDDDGGPALGNLEASIDTIMERYIQTKPDGTLTKEGIRQVFEALDLEYTSRASRRRLRTTTKPSTNDVSEVYSPPRVTEVAEATGLRAGWALDLTIKKEDGEPWDLSIPHNQVEALRKQEQEAPVLLIASPMCAAFSTLQNLNYRNMTPKELEAKLKAAIDHLDFALKMCEIQAKNGRYFVFEHPVQARSWSLSLVKRLFKYKDVTTVDFDFCQLGMHSQGYPARKRTRIMTNSLCISKRLSRFQCDHSHQHIPLMNGRAGACQVYPRNFCAQLCLGLKEELAKGAIAEVHAHSAINPTMAAMAPQHSTPDKHTCAEVIRELLEVLEPHPHEDTEYMQYLYSGKEFFDDVHGKWLEKDRAIEARRLELYFFQKNVGIHEGTQIRCGQCQD